MKSFKTDIKTKAFEIGRNTSRVAEAVQTDVALKYAEILNGDIKASSVKEAFDIMEQNTIELLSTALASFSDINAEVSTVTSSLFEKGLKTANRLVKIDSDNAIKDYLFKITGNQLIEEQKVTYKNGRKIGYKEYVEMATRTRVQHQLLEQEKEFGEMTQQLFYISDTYTDCANDHIEYQGKIYYDEKVWRGIKKDNPHYDELESAVRKAKDSVENVTQNRPWLCTRPNCRHRLIPIPIDDVIDLSDNDILRKNKAFKGNYSKSEVKRNYDDTQRQRKIEHAIRQAKVKHEIMERAYRKTKDEDYLKAMNRNAFVIRNNQAKMRALISSNSNLKRDYRRENPYHLQKDLGVAYNSAPVRVRIEAPQENIQDIVKWSKKFDGDLTREEIKEYESTVEWVDDSKKLFESLDTEEKQVVRMYTVNAHKDMNRFMYDNEGLKKDMFDIDVFNAIQKKVETLHRVFKKNREANITTDKTLVAYRGMNDVVGENDTTLILNSFTSSSLIPQIANNFLRETVSKGNVGIRLKIYIPPKSQNQTFHYTGMDESEVLIDTNAVFDIIGESTVKVRNRGSLMSVKQYEVVLRPKHKGVQR